MNSKTILFFYFILLSVEIYAEILFFQTSNSFLIYITKPLLMPTLIAWTFLFAKEHNITFNKIIFIALIFSMFGDTALMLLNIFPGAFIIGLICFLIAHIIYIVLLSKLQPLYYSAMLAKPYLILPFILYGVLLVTFLYWQNHPDFIKMQIAVIVYAIVILTMLLMAFSCYTKKSQNSFMILFSGAILFVLSDTTIALSKFSHLFEDKQFIARVIIMLLYGIAQFLIVKGYINFHKNSTIHS
jgi:uncharacterized membrane protein YhhN